MEKKTTVLLILAVGALLILIGLLIDPIPQPQSYHNFADQRSLPEVTNIWNVLSNILFALAGIWGLFLLLPAGKIHFIDHRERWLWIAVSGGLVLTAFGSSYYHLAPDNDRLVWDRLPMTIVFMSYLAALICERININVGLCVWPMLLGLGFFSVLHWHATELRDAGDLRFYLGLEVFTILVTLIMLFVPSPYDRIWDLAVVITFFGLARVFEIFDHQIFLGTHGIVSGHTLKHLSAGMAGIWLIRMIWKRKIIQPNIRKNQ